MSDELGGLRAVAATLATSDGSLFVGTGFAYEVRLVEQPRPGVVDDRLRVAARPPHRPLIPGMGGDGSVRLRR